MKYSSDALSVLMLFAVLVFCDYPVLGQGGDIMYENERSSDGEKLEKRATYPRECTPEFRKFKGHTMCLHDSPDVTKSGVSSAEKQLIVNLHNKLRSQVSPSGKDLTKVIWDDKIAAIAQKWAKQCNFGHDRVNNVPSYGISIGQNVAFGSSDWTAAVNNWHSEVQMFRYGQDPKVYIGPNGWMDIGHYTQIVQGSLGRIGCGYAQCHSTTNYHICNYAPGQYKFSRPYNSGTSCSACPNKCSNNLCDCKGKLCFNRGRLNLNTCKCTCTKHFEGSSCERPVCGGLRCKNRGTLDKKTCRCNCPRPYVGKSCQTKDCRNVNDKYDCKYYNKGDCNYTNIPPKCPKMCGLC